jgi:hypothetical protein
LKDTGKPYTELLASDGSPIKEIPYLALGINFPPDFHPIILSRIHPLIGLRVL